MIDFHCDNCEFLQDKSNDNIIDGYCKKYNQSLTFYDWFEKCDKCFIETLQSENAALRERLNITKMALEYACLETLQSNEQYLEELKEKVNKYIKQSEDVVYGQKNGVTFRFAEARLAELKGGKNE